MKTLNDYETAERNLLTQYFNTNKVYSYNLTPPEKRRPYDATYQINPGDLPIFVEAKVRSFEITKYPDYILEMPKIMSLAKFADLGHIVQYFNFFRRADASYDLLVFNLNFRFCLWRKQGPSIIQKKWMTLRTFQNPDHKVEKDVIMIKYDKMTDFVYTNTGWKL